MGPRGNSMPIKETIDMNALGKRLKLARVTRDLTLQQPRRIQRAVWRSDDAASRIRSAEDLGASRLARR